MAQRPDQFTLNASHPLAQGLVFAGLGQLPGSTRYHDSSAYGNTGTLTNMEPATDWIFSTQLNRMSQVFDGINEWIDIGGSKITGYPYTLSVWMKPVTSAECTGICLSDKSEAGTYTFIRYNAGSSAYNFSRRLEDSPADATGGSATGAFDHIVGVARSATDAELFVNGVSVATNTTSIAFGSGIDQTSVGVLLRSTSTLTNPMNGPLSDQMIYARALSTAEIRILADPSNVMLSGLLQPPRRKWWPVVSGAAVFKPYWANQATQVAM